MLKQEDLQIGELVRYKGKIMMVASQNSLDPDFIGLVSHEDMVNYTYYPIEDVTKLAMGKINSISLRALFQGVVTIFDLAKDNQFPFEDADEIVVNEEDINVFIRHLKRFKDIDVDFWKGIFVLMELAAVDDEKEANRFNLHYIFEILKVMMLAYEEEEYENISSLWKYYLTHKGIELNQLEIPDLNVAMPLFNYYRQKDYFESVNFREFPMLNNCLEIMAKSDDYFALIQAAYTYYGLYLQYQPDWPKAEAAMLRLQEMGDIDSALALGYLYYSDRLGEPDYEKAYHYFSIAAEKGNSDARCQIADMLRYGEGVEKDTKKAYEILEELYKEENRRYYEGDYDCRLSDVALRLGYCYENGEGVPSDRRKALDYYELAKKSLEYREEFNEFTEDTITEDIDRALQRAKLLS